MELISVVLPAGNKYTTRCLQQTFPILFHIYIYMRATSLTFSMYTIAGGSVGGVGVSMFVSVHDKVLLD